ncbi:GNAT family N-acetyltransferase [Asanoa sp. WMMD1127]|uniref:GNAT family N-acetyltransferase n=1 Tax=Asanoa sp. WMMD1127 TaxID=3016107 RepID=UPI002416AEF3|nr:GNAT family N-acetyltransferase [Asanoa sp. WMMD1127]MDG4820900.1 GNAT family N-acetyltransferase [Asanoa sp. WMMD1127]
MRREPIELPTVRLRALRDDDTDDVVAACNDPLIQRFLPALPRPYTAEHALTWIRDDAPWAAGGASWAIADPASDRLVGTIGVHHVDRDRMQGEIGYWAAPWARGKGLTTEATRATAERAFADGFERLEILVDLANPRSVRIALAAGFRPEGTRRGAARNADGSRRDVVVFARLPGDSAAPVDRLLPDLPGGQLSDGVVTLRPVRPDDAGFYHELFSTPDIVASHVPPVAPDLEELQLRCARAESRWLLGERADLVMVDTATGAPAGDIGLYYQEPMTGQAMIGYCVLPAFRGRGFARRASVLLARWVFADTGIARLIAGTNPANAGSQRVLESAGFLREGYQRRRLPGLAGGRIDDVLWALLPGDLPESS